MKKLIESELISIAHRILKLNDKTDLQTLLAETRKIYEKLAVLQFYEENKSRLDSSITEEKLTTLLHSQKEETTTQPVSFLEEKEEVIVTEIIDFPASTATEDPLLIEKEFSNEPVPAIMPQDISEEETRSEIIVPLNEKTESEAHSFTSLDIDPVYNISFDEIEFEQKTTSPLNPVLKTETVPAGENTAEQVKSPAASAVHAAMENQHILSTTSKGKDSTPFHQIPLNRTINDAFSKMVTIGLNDRIAFEKHLFNNSSEDLNRVISQLNTIETYQEAQDFIEDLVKPDFNNWQGKEEYANRFMTMIEKRFL